MATVIVMLAVAGLIGAACRLARRRRLDAERLDRRLGELRATIRS